MERLLFVKISDLAYNKIDWCTYNNTLTFEVIAMHKDSPEAGKYDPRR